MLSYAIIHISILIMSMIGGLLIWKQQKNTSGFFFFLVTFFGGLWFLGYYLFFLNIFSESINLFITRSTFCVGVFATVSLCGFSYFYNHKYVNIKKILLILMIFFSLVFALYTMTNGIISGIVFDKNEGVYREIFGNLFNIHFGLYILSTISLLLIIIYKIKRLYFLQKIRFQQIVFSTFLFIVVLLIFQLILPYFGIWIFEKGLIFIFFLYIVYILYTIKRYYFSPLHQEYGFLKIGAIVGSFVLSITLLNIIKYFYSNSSYISSFWNISDKYGILDGLIIISGYSIFYFFLKKFLSINDSEQKLKKYIDELKHAISDSTTLEHLNKILHGGVRNIFKTNMSRVIVFDNEGIYPGLYSYFSQPLGEKVFINDFVFIEENKSKFDKRLILNELDKNVMLVFPLFSTDSVLIGLYFLGKKPFGDFYTTNEIKMIFSLTKFLGLHLKYLNTYKKIQDYSLQLDQRIDEKTMEYNDLINKQKEFISMISHEVRSPIGSTIFQVDSLLDDINKNKISSDELKNTVKSIGDQLIRIGDLLKKLFSVQYFDTRNVELLKEKIQISSLLEKEFDIYSRMYENVSFIKKISNDIGFVNIDKIHFHQVLNNLLENAIKFADSTNPVILIESYKDNEGNFYINIEDNGNGYNGIDPSTIFEKYSTGNHAKLGLGMGLYLCKTIIMMHHGSISAENGRILGGASFVIKLPI